MNLGSKCKHMSPNNKGKGMEPCHIPSSKNLIPQEQTHTHTSSNDQSASKLAGQKLKSSSKQMQLPSLRRRGEKRPFWCFSRLSDLAAHKDRWLPFKFRATSLSLRQNARHLAHFPPRDARRPTHFGTSEQPQHVFVSFFCCFNPPFESSMTSTTSTIFTPSLY
jgi:hypothetical protein